MIKLNKNALLIAILLIGTIGFAGCSSAPTATNNANTAVVVNKPVNTTTDVVVNKPANTTTNITKTETTTGDKIGIPECDEYVEKYEACINSKVPEAERAMLKTPFEAQRKSFKDSAANPQARTALANGCKSVLEMAKESMSSYSCAW